MFTRVFECNVHPTKREDLNRVLHDEVLPILQKQPGFLELISLVSDDRFDHALAITFWNTGEEARRFYGANEPMLDLLRPLLSEPPKVENYVLDASLFPLHVETKTAAA